MRTFHTILGAALFIGTFVISFSFGPEKAPYLLLYGFAISINILLLIMALSREYRSQAFLFFLGFVSSLILWGISTFVQSVTLVPSVYEYAGKVGGLGFVLLPVHFLSFVLGYTNRYRILTNYKYLALAFGSAFIFLFFQWNTDLIVPDAYELALHEVWGLDPPTGPLFPAFLAWFELLTITGLFILVKSYRQSESPEVRVRLRLLIIGVLVPLIGGTISNGILPILNISVFPAAVPLTGVLAGVIGYTTVRYGFFDINPSTVSDEILFTLSESVISIDSSGSITFVNRTALELLGLTNEMQLIGSGFEKIVKDKEATKRIKEMLEFPGRSISRLRTEIGGTRSIPVLLSASQIIDRDNVVGLVMVFSDIREIIKKGEHLEQLLRESGVLNKELEKTKSAMLNLLEDLEGERRVAEAARAKDDAVFTSIGDGLVVSDAHAKVILANDEALRLLNAQRNSAIGKTPRQLWEVATEGGTIIPPDERPIELALKKKRKTSGRFILIPRKGKSLPVALTTTPIVAGEEIIGAVQVFRDITKEVELEKARIEFISLASHQLRTPLSAIKWFSEMLASGDAGKLNKEQAEFNDNIVISTNRMIELINILLNISRIESGRIRVEPKPTHLLDLVKDVETQLRPKVEEKKIKLIVNSYKEVPIINVDPSLIREVYANIISNAIKYTPEKGEIDVVISKKGNVIESQISDSGFGIPKDEQKKVFEKFFRGRNVQRFVTEGTGLGLYLTKVIVESSGGKIWFKSTEDKGTTFWFTLPLEGQKAKSGEVSLGGSAGS